MANIIKTTLEDANDVLTYNNRASFPSSGESGKLYIAADTKYTYFWNGSSYVETRGSGYASSSHTHDDRYYTESEVNNKLKDLDNYVSEKNMLTDNINLNTVITSGFYRLQAISTHINGTDISYGQMIVCQGGGDTIAQLVFPYLSSKMLFRTGHPVNNPGGKWNDWKTVALTNDIPTSLKNPKSLKFGSKSYDGSSEVQLTASDLGISIPEITATTSGNGNAVTGISAIGHALTITKGSTFLTSHLYRPIQVNGTQILANNSSTALNLKTGSNISITNSSGTVTINATNTTYSAGTGLSLNGTTFSVKTGYTTNGKNYKVAADSNGNLYVNVPWSSNGTLDTSLNSSSTNALQNKAIYSAFSSAVGYDTNYYFYGEIGSWRLRQYNTTGNSLDIKYGVIAINSQSAKYSVSFSGKNFNSTNYTVVFGLYRSNTQSWFWSPIVQSKTVSGFTVFLRGNSGGDNGGTIMYLAIRSN